MVIAFDSFFFLFFGIFWSGAKKCFLLFCLLIFWYTQLFLLFSKWLLHLYCPQIKKHILDVRLWSWFLKKTCPFVTKKRKQWTVFCFNLTNLELLFFHAYHMTNWSASHKQCKKTSLAFQTFFNIVSKWWCSACLFMVVHQDFKELLRSVTSFLLIFRLKFLYDY